MKKYNLFLSYLVILFLSSNIFSSTRELDNLHNIKSIQKLKIFKIEDNRVARSTYLKNVLYKLSVQTTSPINRTHTLSEVQKNQHNDRIKVTSFIRNELRKLSNLRSNIIETRNQLQQQNLAQDIIAEHPRYLNSIKAYLNEERLPFNSYASDNYNNLIINFFSTSITNSWELTYVAFLKNEASKNVINKLKNLFQYYWYSEKFFKA